MHLKAPLLFNNFVFDIFLVLSNKDFVSYADGNTRMLLVKGDKKEAVELLKHATV